MSQNPLSSCHLPSPACSLQTASGGGPLLALAQLACQHPCFAHVSPGATKRMTMAMPAPVTQWPAYQKFQGVSVGAPVILEYIGAPRVVCLQLEYVLHPDTKYTLE
jgi:hypothetical protein